MIRTKKASKILAMLVIVAMLVVVVPAMSVSANAATGIMLSTNCDGLDVDMMGAITGEFTVAYGALFTLTVSGGLGEGTVLVIPYSVFESGTVDASDVSFVNQYAINGGGTFTFRLRSGGAIGTEYIVLLGGVFADGNNVRTVRFTVADDNVELGNLVFGDGPHAFDAETDLVVSIPVTASAEWEYAWDNSLVTITVISEDGVASNHVLAGATLDTVAGVGYLNIPMSALNWVYDEVTTFVVEVRTTHIDGGYATVTFTVAGAEEVVGPTPIELTFVVDDARGTVTGELVFEVLPGEAIVAPVVAGIGYWYFTGWNPAVPDEAYAGMATTFTAQFRDDTPGAVLVSFEFVIDPTRGTTTDEVVFTDVAVGTAIVAPTVTAETGWTFTGWSPLVPDEVYAEMATIFTAQFTAVGGGDIEFENFVVEHDNGEVGTIGRITVLQGGDFSPYTHRVNVVGSSTLHVFWAFERDNNAANAGQYVFAFLCTAGGTVTVANFEISDASNMDNATDRLIYGDVDGDGLITLLEDVLGTFDFTVGAVSFGPKSLLAADVDGDGLITLLEDVLTIADMASGAISQFPIHSM